MVAVSRDRRINIGSRVFVIHLLKVANGCFLMISEGNELRIGSLVLSTDVGGRINSTNMIPDMYGGFLTNLLGQIVAGVVGGIAVTSLFLQGEVDSSTAKTLLAEVKDLVDDALKPS